MLAVTPSQWSYDFKAIEEEESSPMPKESRRIPLDFIPNNRRSHKMSDLPDISAIEKECSYTNEP
jgi:hypothetical protein